MIVISTLDGQISALDATVTNGKGRLLWSIPSPSGPLFSSSLTNVEFKDDRGAYRLVPALDGNLYSWREGRLQVSTCVVLVCMFFLVLHVVDIIPMNACTVTLCNCVCHCDHLPLYCHCTAIVLPLCHCTIFDVIRLTVFYNLRKTRLNICVVGGNECLL